MFYTTIGVENATVKLSDDFTFNIYPGLGSANRVMPTAVGYRLEKSGYIRRFYTNGTWKMTKSFNY